MTGREPKGGVRRLIRVSVVIRSLLAAAAAVVLMASSPVLATDEAQETASGVTMTVEAGLDGYVDATTRVPVAVEITATVLTVGRLQLDFGGTVSTSVEIPAGGVKRYELEGAAPANRRQLTVRLFDGGGNELASQSLRVQLAVDEVLVGMLGVDGVDTAVRSAVSAPLGRSVAALAVETADVGPRLAPLDYLVVGPGTLTGLDERAVDELSEWVRSGGRLYGPRPEVAVVAEPGSAVALGGSPLMVSRVGSGELGVLETPAAVTPAEWGVIVRDRPGSSGIVDQSRQNADLALISAASAGQEASVPALPWLLAGIVVFILLVGPVNFVVLQSLGRPEWAWVTVPLLSMVFLGAFWGIGRSQLVDFSASHGAVVYDRGAGAAGSAGFLLQVSDEGEHVLALPEGWQPVPPAQSIGGASSTGVVTDTGVTFDLDALGLGATETRWQEGPLALAETVSVDGEGIEIAVENGTPWTLWGWGAVVNGVGYNGRETLGPGETGIIEIGRTTGRIAYDPVVAETIGRRPYDLDQPQRTYETVYPLASYLEHEIPDLRQRGAYLFGVTAERGFTMRLNGRSAESVGSTLLVRRIEIDDAALAELGGVRPEVLAVEGASSIERYGDEVYAYGADAVYFHYSVPDGSPSRAKIQPSVGGFDLVEVFDWTEGEFRTFAWDSVFEVADVASPGGEVVVRASVTDGDKFFDQAISLQRYAMRWSGA